MFTMWPLLLLAVQSALAFPFMGTLPGIDKSLLARGYVHNDKRQTISLSCPVNPTHTAAAPYGTFTYSGARNGLPGTGIGGYKVPADGDTAHQFEAPGPNDIRG
jgi:unspecific peroxygenase